MKKGILATKFLRLGLVLTLTLLAGTSMAKAQAPTVFGIGTGMADPQGTLHVHSSEALENLEPLIPIRGSDEDGDGTRDGGGNLNDPDHYLTHLHLTNSATGMTANDGFSLRLYDSQMSLVQHEQAGISFETPGGELLLDKYGNVGVGAIHQGYRLNVAGASRFTGAVAMQSSLTVGGGLHCDAQGNLKVKRLRVTLTDWPDYVFGEGYRLPSLGEVERYVREHSHLPGVPSAKEVEQDGADLGEMNRLLLQKVEELTLYIIDLQKQVNELKSNQRN